MKFKRIEIRNFQAQKSIDIDFGKHTFICGKNGTGKTTVLDAIKWVLFGKDSENKAQFDIRFYDADGNISNEDVSVVLIIDDNGEEKSFCRTLKGSITTCSIDGVPYKVTEYATIVGHLVESEDRFKLLTDPLYFFALNWKDQRELLMNFFPTPDDTIVLAAEARSEEFVKFLKKLTPEQIIASNQLLIKTLAKKRFETEGQLKLLSSYIVEDSSDVDKFVKEREDVDSKIIALNKQIDELAEQNKSIEDAIKVRDKCLDVKHLALLCAQTREATTIIHLTTELEDAEKEKERLTKQYKELLVVDDKCPTCHRAYDEEEVKAQTERVNNLREDVIRQGKAINAKIEELRGKLSNKDFLFSYSVEEREKIASADKQIEDVRLLSEAETADIRDLMRQKDKLVERKEELNRMLGKQDLLAENVESQKNLEKLRLQIIAEMETAENMIAESVAFISKRTQIVATAVNSSFKTIKINLTDTQKNGTVVDTFEIYRGGVPYSALNQGSRLLVGLELVSFLKSKLGIEAPIMFDDAERYDEEIIKSITAQTILLKKTTDDELTIIKED